MIDQLNSTKKESSPQPLEKSSNNIIPNLTTIKPGNETETSPKNKLLNLSESYTNKNNQNFTFKIIKRRAPWNKKEDDAIIELVNKYGISNWTIIANEMANLFKSKHRNGKQCRERWHNHLDPIVNKENWTENEENILFSKHMEYGNRWSDIAKFLPGRTDNSIKNHFYSKLRKFIRKILKQINKENLLKNNGIDCYKYNSDKVYKLLKEYKVNYKNVTKDTILDLIISIEKNQKGKIFNLSEKKSTNSNEKPNINFAKISPNKKNILSNSIIEDNKNSNIENKFISKNSSNKKNKPKIKNNDENNENNFSINKKRKKIFKSKLIKRKDDEKVDNNTKSRTMENQSTMKKNKINKKNEQQFDLENKDKNINNDNIKKKLVINPEYINETFKNKFKSNKKIIKTKIKEKSKIKNNLYDKSKILNKKRRRKKKRKVSISLSTPESKKTRINRIMPKKQFVFGFLQNFSKDDKRRINYHQNQDVFPEDFDPLINNVELIREGLEIHSKSIIVINKNLLTENIFPEGNYTFHPKLNISIPLSPKAQQFPSLLTKSHQNGEENLLSKFNERNITIGPPTPMNGFLEPQISPIALNNIIMFPPNSTKTIYNVDLGYENNFLRKNFPTPYTPKGFINNNHMITPTTPNREINLTNKIIVQNNNNINNINNIENTTNISAEKGNKKPEPLNMQYIENYNENIPFLSGNENTNLNSTINKMNPSDIFNLSPTSPFIPKGFGEKHIYK